MHVRMLLSHLVYLTLSLCSCWAIRTSSRFGTSVFSHKSLIQWLGANAQPQISILFVRDLHLTDPLCLLIDGYIKTPRERRLTCVSSSYFTGFCREIGRFLLGNNVALTGPFLGPLSIRLGMSDNFVQQQNPPRVFREFLDLSLSMSSRQLDSSSIRSILSIFRLSGVGLLAVCGQIIA